MNSMTGFGSGRYSEDGREITVEVKTVNHRFLDINHKLPKHLSFLESEFRKVISSRLSRGHAEIFVSYKNTREDAKKVEVDLPLLGQYLTAADEINDKYGIEKDINFKHVLKMQGVLSITEEDDDQKEICRLANIAVNIAIDNVIAMRKAEGNNLCKDISDRINKVKSMFESIEKAAPKVPVQYMDKLKSRMEDMLSGVNYDEARLLTEAAVFADKCNVDEEIARFKSHIMQFEKCYDVSEPVGRKLDFTLQEINREINTIGSKANDAEIATVVMDIKAELEKIREQVQNVE